MFLSLYNPLYFTEVLGAQGRSMLERLLPCVDKEAVLAAMTESEQALLKGESLLMPEIYMQKRREENAGTDRALVEIQGKLGLLSRQEAETAEKIKAALAEQETVSRELETLVQKKEAGIDFDALVKKHQELKQSYDTMRGSLPGLPDVSGLDQKLREVESALLSKQNQPFIGSHEQALQELSRQIELLAQHHKQLGGRAKGLRPNVRCPICRTVITEDSLADVRAGFQRELSEIQEKGQELQIKYKKLLVKTALEKQAFIEKQAEELSVLTGQRDALLEQRARILREAREEAEKSARSLQSLQTELASAAHILKAGNLTAEELERTKEIQRRQNELDISLRQLRGYCYQTVRKDYTEQMAELEQKQRRNAALIAAASEFWYRQSEIQMQNLRTKNLEIQLHEVVKTTGEYKNVFRVSYKGRSFRLSCSERLRAGLEFVGLLQKLTGRCYPVAIDEADNMTDLPRPAGQVLMTKFIRELPLSVKLDNQKELIPICAKQSGKGEAA